MIHGTSVFSMADLNGSNGHLYGMYKRNKFESIECECIEENEKDGVTEILTKTGEYLLVKTGRLYNLHHSDEKLW